MSDLEDWFDENIPDEVLNDESWSPKLLPDLNNLNNSNFGYADIIDEDEEDDDF